MIAGELISNIIPPLRTSDTVRKALDRMNEFKVYHLPFVNEAQYLGLVSEEELMEARDMLCLILLPSRMLMFMK